MPNIKLSSLKKGLVLDLDISSEGLQGTTKFKDKTPYENNGTLSNVTLTTDHKGKANSAGLFNGTSSYIDCGNDSSLTIADNITISLWFKNEYTPPTYSAYLCRYQTFGGKRIWAVSYTNGIVSYWSKNGLSGIGTSAINVENGVWYNFVCTFESGIVKQYLNGELKTTDDISASVDSLYETSTRLVIGARDEGLGFYMNGSIERPSYITVHYQKKK
jgi:hypothetical protein